MKKLITAILFLASFTVAAQSSSVNIGKDTNSMGVTTGFSVMIRGGEKSLFMYMRGRHGIRKVYTSMSIHEAKRVRALLDEAISNIEGDID